jgi:hypothetical protein
MFPDVRLLIAATLASVLALICGFGVFAAFRVSHDPLTRLPPATAALQPVADKGARLPVVFAPAESFDRRFLIAAPAEPIAAAPGATAAIGDDKPGSAVAVLPETTPVVIEAPPAASSPDAATAEAGHEGGSTPPSEVATGDGEVAAAPKVAVESSPVDPTAALAEEKPASGTPPTDEEAKLQPAANAVAPRPDAQGTDKLSNEQRTWHIGAGAPPRHNESAHVAPAQIGAQDGGIAQGDSRSKAQPPKQPLSKRAAHVRSRTQESKRPPNSGIGGPFVSVPGQP